MLTRNVTLTFVIAFLVTVAARAQSPDTLKAPATHDQFPIGVLIDGEHQNSTARLDSLVKMLGINSYFELHSAGNADSFSREGQPFDTIVPITDPFYYDPASAPYYPSYLFSPPGKFDSSIVTLLTEAVQSPEVRVFMPGTSGMTREYNYSWEYALGGPANHYDSLIFGGGNPNEWFIPSDVVTSSGDYVLKLSDATTNPASTDPFQFVNPAHVGAYTFDFVFWMDTLIIPSGNLYRAEISDGSTILSTVYIDAASYKALPIAIESINGRTVGADSLAIWKSPTGPQQTAHKYRRLRITIPAATARAHNGDPINFKLFSYGVWSLYPRLLRIRN